MKNKELFVLKQAMAFQATGTERKYAGNAKGRVTKIQGKLGHTLILVVPGLPNQFPSNSAQSLLASSSTCCGLFSLALIGD
jgi:hypothetical protein